MQVSQAGLELIKRNEGCELVAYLDRLANPPVWTIGYGDTLGVHEGMRITQEEAEARLLNRLANEFVPGVLRALKGAPVTQNQLDAMASLAWNIGVGRLDNPDTPQNEGSGFSGSTVARKHREGDYAAAAKAFAMWNKAGGVVLKGLVRRRQEEAELYLRQDAQGASPAPVTAVDVSEDIKAIQAVLARSGRYTAAIDGDFGRRSRQALSDLLAADGQPRV